MRVAPLSFLSTVDRMPAPARTGARGPEAAAMVVSTALAPFLRGWLLAAGVGLEPRAWGWRLCLLLAAMGIALALRHPAAAGRVD